jgi:hypothetical protein
VPPPTSPVLKLFRKWSDDWLRDPGGVEWIAYLAKRFEEWDAKRDSARVLVAPDEEYLNSLWNRCGTVDDYGHHVGNIFEYAHAVLTCCGQVLSPISATDRLPDPRPESEGGDCDEEGRCFAWDWLASDWRMVPVEWVQTKHEYNWWFPAYVLPVP